jgi:SAM-dependent methyltransferase
MLHSELLLALLLPLAASQAEEKKLDTPRYETRQDHDPNGTGKFYLGREIAQVMGYGGASWLERPEREKEEHCSKLLPSLEIKPGDAVADFGAGSGFYTERLAKLVGPKGRVFAVDIQPEMLALVKNRAKAKDLKNVTLVHNTPTDPRLPAESVNLILMVDVYHELAHPYEVTAALVKALKPGGRLVFVEFRGEDDNVPILLVHKMTEKQVVKEMEPFPLRHVRTLGHLPWQHIIIFEKRAEGTPPASTPAPKEPGTGTSRSR